MYYDMVQVAEKTGADIVCCDYFQFHQIENNIKRIKYDEQLVLTYSRSDAIKKMLYPQYFKCFACNKLYKSNLFQEIRFPEGKLYEDIYTCYLLLSKANKVSYYRQKLYGYRIRENSITREKYNPRSSELIEAINQVLADVTKESAEYEDILQGYIFYYMTYINLMIRSNVQEGQYGEYIKSVIKNNYGLILKSCELDKKRKIQYWLYANMAPVYKQIIKWFKR
jgi:effector-binding domain-containing protein